MKKEQSEVNPINNSSNKPSDKGEESGKSDIIKKKKNIKMIYNSSKNKPSMI